MDFDKTCKAIDQEFSILSERARDRLKKLIESNRLDAYNVGYSKGRAVQDYNDGDFNG